MKRLNVLAPNRCPDDWNEGLARTARSKHRQNALRKTSFSTASTRYAHPLVPAKAGTLQTYKGIGAFPLDSRFRGNERISTHLDRIAR